MSFFAVGISANPQVRWAAGYRSAPANISRDQLMRGGSYYSKQPSARVFNGVPRPTPPPDNTSPGQRWLRVVIFTLPAAILKMVRSALCTCLISLVRAQIASASWTWQ